MMQTRQKVVIKENKHSPFFCEGKVYKWEKYLYRQNPIPRWKVKRSWWAHHLHSFTYTRLSKKTKKYCIFIRIIIKTNWKWIKHLQLCKRKSFSSSSYFVWSVVLVCSFAFAFFFRFVFSYSFFRNPILVFRIFLQNSDMLHMKSSF